MAGLSGGRVRGRGRAAVLLLAGLVALGACSGQPPPDGVPNVPPFEALDLDLTCDGAPFPAAALDGPAGAEREATAEAEALRALLASDHGIFLPVVGWRVVSRTADTVEFLAEARPADRIDAAYAQARFERQGAEWTPVGWGGCQPRLVLDGLSLATWELDPDRPLPTAGTTAFVALVSEIVCTSGRKADGRVLPPAIFYGPEQVRIIFAVQPLPAGGIQTCPAPPPTPYEVHLTERLGERALVDGSTVPPRDPFPEIVVPDVDPLPNDLP